MAQWLPVGTSRRGRASMSWDVRPQRANLDIILTYQEVCIAAPHVALADVLTNHVSWGKEYVDQQLSEPRITFATDHQCIDGKK